jgi:hypothetical protein
MSHAAMASHPPSDHETSLSTGLICPAVDGPVRGDEGIAIYRIILDERLGVIRTDVRGFWQTADAAAYFDHLARFINAARRRFGAAKVLVNRRENSVQSAEVAELMRAANARLYRPTDRLAIVTGSSLLLMQMRRLFSHPGSRAFLSLEEAEAWLTDRHFG